MLGGRTCCLVLVAVALSGASRADDGNAGQRPGLKAYVDPDSGRLVPGPVVPEPAAPLPAPVPLAEEPAPGGGTMVRLNGQFMSNLVATVNPDGSVRIDCVSESGSPHPHPH
jgi:hypothetical protein